jgi:cytochrome b
MTNTIGVRVWDLPLRLTHLGFIICVGGSFATAKFDLLNMQWHFYFGYALLALLFFRISWGFCGTRQARFSRFLRGPQTVARYAISLLRKDTPASVGHNPMGGWAVLALLGAMFWQAGTGLFSNDEIEYFGPLSERVSAAATEQATHWHHLGENLVLAVVAIHLLAIGFHVFFKRENLIAPMIHGIKALTPSAELQISDLTQKQILVRSAICCVISIFWVWALLRFFPS